MRMFLVSAVACLALATGIACGDDDNDADPTTSATTTGTAPSGSATASSTRSVTPTGNVLTDEAYLAVFCEGFVNYQDAVNTETTVEGIRSAVLAYIDSMSSIRPPEDVQPFHDEYLAYLEGAVDDPTALLVRPAPLPEDDVRDRLALKVPSVPECKYPTFLGGNQ